jgi:hypothetical protein
MENLIKLHKAQLASDRMSCHSATANQVRLVLHTAEFWLMHGVRAAIPRTNALANSEFATIRERLIKIGARVIKHIARIRVQLPTSCPEGTAAPSHSACCRLAHELRGSVPRRAAKSHQPQTRCTASCLTLIRPGGTIARVRVTDVAKMRPVVHDPG